MIDSARDDFLNNFQWTSPNNTTVKWRERETMELETMETIQAKREMI